MQGMLGSLSLNKKSSTQELFTHAPLALKNLVLPKKLIHYNHSPFVSFQCQYVCHLL